MPRAAGCRRVAWIATCFAAMICRDASAQDSDIVDVLSFGDSASEQAHDVTAEHSDVVVGPRHEMARRLLPLDPQSWEGGKLSATLKVDPLRPNYVTVRLWGSDISSDRLLLFCDGRQIGYRHLGDVGLLDDGSDAPFCNGRFFYSTSPLPLVSTKGKRQVHLEVRSSGPIWGYGANWEQYQKPLRQPTRGLYRLYVHTDGAFSPPAGEKQGSEPVDPPVRVSPGTEVLDQIKLQVNHALAGLLRSPTPVSQMPMQFLARAYFVKWTPAYRNPQAIEQIVVGLDALWRAYRKDPKLAESDPATPNPGWFGLGPAGETISLLIDSLKPRLDEAIEDGAGRKVTRRAAFAEMLTACRDFHRRHRRQYTNQTMINDLYGIYWANRGVAATDPAQARPEAECRRYLYESVGMQPWLGSDTDAGPSRSAGGDFMQLTAKGLSRELGYVGNYGEVLDWATQIYDATRPAPDQPGDPRIKEQLAKIARARAAFRYPALDDDGNRAMRMETVVGWRDVHFPGDVTYAQRPSWDGSPVQAAAATLDPALVGYAQQMFADNQFFATMQQHIHGANFRIVAGLLSVPDDYETIKAQPPSPRRLPMASKGGDYSLADEEDGVVAVKHGDEILYVSLYWRARYAINNLARVHSITPTFDRIATVREETEYEPSGLTYTRPDWVNMGFGGGGIHYPADLHSALAGEKLPIARFAGDSEFKPGTESLYAGRGSFYRLRYGNYWIGMNMTKDKIFRLEVPPGQSTAPDLISGKTLALDKPIEVPPRSTVVLWLAN